MLFLPDIGALRVYQICDEEVQHAAVFGEGGEVIVGEKNAKHILGEVVVQFLRPW